MITMTHEFPPEDPCLKKVLKVWQEHNVYSEEVLRGAREHVSCHCENRRQAPKPTLTETKATATIDSTARKRREEAEITRKIEEFRREVSFYLNFFRLATFCYFFHFFFSLFFLVLSCPNTLYMFCLC